MYESEEDIARLENIIQKTAKNAGSYLRDSAINMEKYSASAKKLTKFLGSNQTIVLATTNSKGHPKVALITSLFYKGHFYLPTVNRALRTRHIKKNNNISLAYFSNFKGLDITGHGTAEILQSSNELFEELNALLKKHVGDDVTTYGKGNEGIFLKITLNKIYSFDHRIARD